MASYQPFTFGSVWDRQNLFELNKMSEAVGSFTGSALLEESYNLFDKDQAGDGSINSSTGAVNSDGFKHGTVYVKPNTNYVTNTKGAGAFYDAADKFISGVSSSNTQFKTPANAYIYRMTLGTYQLDTFMIHEGTTLKPYKPFGYEPAKLILAPELQQKINEAMDYFEDFDALTINKGKDFPLRSVQLGSQAPVAIPSIVKNVLLDATVSGAKTGRYYRVTFISNGFVQGGQPRYGITVEERRMSDGWRERYVFTYNDGNTPENQQNYNIEKTSDGIDTIIADNGEIVISLTVDRAAITASSNPTYLNLNSGASKSPSAVIDPSVYGSF